MTRPLFGCATRFALFAALMLLCLTARAFADHVRPVDQLGVPAGEAPTQCRSYGRTRTGQATAQAVYAHERLVLSALLFGRGEQAARALYEQYLKHGTVSPIRQDVDDPRAASEFAADPQTMAAYRHLRADLHAAAIHFRPADATQPATGTFRGFATARTGSFVMQTSSTSVQGAASYMAIDYTPDDSGAPASILQASTTPALIAGGTGSAVTQRGTFLDTREITGDWTLRPSTDQSGPVTRQTLALTHVRLAIKDSVDFCPGGLGSMTRRLLLPLSRLERTPFDGGGWVHPVLWKTLVALPDAAVGVTERDIARHGAGPGLTGLPDRIGAFVSQLASAAHRLLESRSVRRWPFSPKAASTTKPGRMNSPARRPAASAISATAVAARFYLTVDPRGRPWVMR